ncbi:MAG: PTS sugar transporter subunit IIC [Endomicrobium sp.]|nr:PTS sugar transporter subunit IIC [Endomicrobium sp.]
MTENIIFLAFIGALCSSDITAFGQFMICRPIFCAPVMGFLMGDIGTGLWIGMIVEMLWINAIPLGVSIPVDVSLIGVLSTFWVCKYFSGFQEAAILGIILAVPFAYLYREIDISGRKFNTKIMRWIEKGIESGKYWQINAGVITGLLFFVLRAFLFCIFAMIVGGWIYFSIYPQLPEFVLLGFKKAWYLMPIAGFGMMIYNFKSVKIPLLRNSRDD